MNNSKGKSHRAGLFRDVSGLFFRSIDPDYKSSAIRGSRLAGRYSSPDQPTLYLSSTPESVKAALRAHKANRSAAQEIIKIEVEAERIFDLRDQDACEAAGIDLAHAMSPWQPLVAQGEKPPSWHVRDRLVELGAMGLIDPSRQMPELWHLVLFAWNVENAPRVKIVS